MKVVQVINHCGLDRGGAERLVRQLHIDLLSEGIDSHLIALEECNVAGVANSHSLGFKSPRDPRVLPSLAAALRTFAEASDLIHTHLFPSSAYISILKRCGWIRVPCVFTEHNTWNKRRENQLFRTLDRFVYPGFEKVFAISKGTEHELVRSYPNVRGRTQIIQNGSNLRYTDFRKRNPHDKIQILSIGSLTHRKNYDTALLALSKLKDVEFHYTILGEGPERSRLLGLVGELGIGPKVTFAGHVEILEPWLESSDIFLMPSRWEGFGLAAVEAMNAGLPVVASDVPGLREVTGEDGVCALLVSPDDIEGIGSAIRQVSNSGEDRLRMGKAGFIRSAEFSRSRMTENYVDAYRQVIGISR